MDERLLGQQEEAEEAERPPAEEEATKVGPPTPPMASKKQTSLLSLRLSILVEGEDVAPALAEPAPAVPAPAVPEEDASRKENRSCSLVATGGVTLPREASVAK